MTYLFYICTNFSKKTNGQTLQIKSQKRHLLWDGESNFYTRVYSVRVCVHVWVRVEREMIEVVIFKWEVLAQDSRPGVSDSCQTVLQITRIERGIRKNGSFSFIHQAPPSQAPETLTFFLLCLGPMLRFSTCMD
jgi:hypothetical protein